MIPGKTDGMAISLGFFMIVFGGITASEEGEDSVNGNVAKTDNNHSSIEVTANFGATVA